MNIDSKLNCNIVKQSEHLKEINSYIEKANIHPC